jgi:hypothetical protein
MDVCPCRGGLFAFEEFFINLSFSSPFRAKTTTQEVQTFGVMARQGELGKRDVRLF